MRSLQHIDPPLLCLPGLPEFSGQLCEKLWRPSGNFISNTTGGFGPAMTIMVSTTTSYMEIPFELIKTEGNFYFEWDQQDGLFTPAAVGQDARLVHSSDLRGSGK